MTTRLSGKSAVITGASGAAENANIGCAIAVAMVREGAEVLVADTNEAGVHELVELIATTGGRAAPCVADVSREADVQRMMAQAVATFGRLDIVVNNAAIVDPADHDAATMSVDVWDRTFAVNARGVMLGCKHALPILLAQGGGVIVNMTSAQGLIGDESHPAYGASKAAIAVLTKYVATQYGRQGIRCNAVAPGLTLTARALQDVPVSVQDIHLKHVLAPRLAHPNDVANVVVFLSSEESALINAETLVADGGMNSHRALTVDMQALRRGLGGIAVKRGSGPHGENVGRRR